MEPIISKLVLRWRLSNMLLEYDDASNMMMVMASKPSVITRNPTITRNIFQLMVLLVNKC